MYIDKDIVERFLNGENAYSRRKRVCELMSQLTEQEIIEFTLPRVKDIVPPVDLFLEGSSCTSDIFSEVSLLYKTNLSSLSTT